MNTTWCKIIVDTLKTCGVRYFCLAPGSRSSPLAIAAAKSRLETLVHFDERGLGFLGLGLAKLRKEPVALLVTSGTAVGNLLPAIMEASHDELPLIILSADRPPELRDVGANQTTDQVKLYANFTRWQVDLPCSERFLTRYLMSTVSQAVAIAKRRKGPVQINCMLREPLIAGPPEETSLQCCHHEDGILCLSDNRIQSLADLLGPVEKGIVICGQDSPFEASLIAKRLQWPLFADVASSLRGISSHEICYYESILKTASIERPNAILQFGKRIFSKTLLEFLKKSPPTHYIQINDCFSRFDPDHLVTHRFQVQPKEAATALHAALPEKEPSQWLFKWQEAAEQTALKIHDLLENSYSEPGFAFNLTKTSIDHFFFANSMPIRDAEAFFFPQKGMRRIFANRGLSGIDGNIATCAGIAYSCEAPLIAVLGDMTFLHDLNSLAILQETLLPILFLVINNQGGGIFSFLPHLANASHFDQVIAYAHDYQFKAIAEQFRIAYSTARDREEFLSCLKQFEENPTTRIVEVFTQREENVKWHREIEASLKITEEVQPVL
jgi:2-succinyl-5-enolpyruvyl-6-hydroxy-3-cyclohexene-1-carboxylate synthase